MSTLVSYTTITLSGGEGEVNISIEAQNSSLPPAGRTNLFVYTSPDTYLSNTGVKVTDGSVSGGSIKVGIVEKEVLTITRSDRNSFATGSLSKTPYGTPTYRVVSTLGSGSSVSFSGNSVVANNINTDALVLEVTYKYRYKEYKFTAPSSSSIPAVIAQGILNV